MVTKEHVLKLYLLMYSAIGEVQVPVMAGGIGIFFHGGLSIYMIINQQIIHIKFYVIIKPDTVSMYIKQIILNIKVILYLVKSVDIKINPVYVFR